MTLAPSPASSVAACLPIPSVDPVTSIILSFMMYPFQLQVALFRRGAVFLFLYVIPHIWPEALHQFRIFSKKIGVKNNSAT
jgi:hypothetical protein